MVMRMELYHIPPIIDVETKYIKYRFYVDKKRRRVSGIARTRDRRMTARVKCSASDVFDPLVGIAVCRLKLDNKLGFIRVGSPLDDEHVPKRYGWPRLKSLLFLHAG